jgi:multidrug efflux pump subunit AcrB
LSGLIGAAVAQRRLILSVAAVLALVGMAAWTGMIRQEDPSFPYRGGFVLVPYPGADPERVERLVLEPLEEELAQVQDIDFIQSTVRSGQATVRIRFEQHVYDTDTHWDRVRVAVQRAQQEFPDGVGEPIVDDRAVDNASAVVTVSGVDDLTVLADVAERVKKRLFRLDGISRVEVVGDPGKQVTIAYSDAVARRLGLAPESLAAQLDARNRVSSGGTVLVAGKTATLRPESEFRSIDEIRMSPILLPSGTSVPLSEIATTTYGPAEPGREFMWVNGLPAIGLSVIIERDTVHVVKFGQRLQEMVAKLDTEFEPLSIGLILFQPDHVKYRLDELGRSLLLGIIIVAAILFLTMGMRLGLLVASVVPLVTLSSLALYAIGGGVLHQMAIAGMVIGLGMLVDNAIVMVENMQWHLDHGLSRTQASLQSVKELAKPLGSATGTTLAAFVPMLISKGNTADFTRMIPAMVMLTLAVSYFFAIFVTPALAEFVLRPNPHNRDQKLVAMGRWLGGFADRHSVVVLIAAASLVALAAFGAQFVDRDFFPNTSRSEMVIDLNFAEGTHVSTTSAAAVAMANELLLLPEVDDVYTWTGFSGPVFFYNLTENPRSPHIGRLAVMARSADDLSAIFTWARAYARDRLPDVEVVPQRFGQGPPVTAPIEIRLFGDDFESLRQATEQVMDLARAMPGTADVRESLGTGSPTLVFEVEDAAASRYGLDRSDVALALRGRTLGIEIGQYRAGQDPVPIVIRSPEGERFSTDHLDTAYVFAPDGQTVPLAQLVRQSLVWQPSAIQHRDLQRVTTVLSQLDEGYAFGNVTSELQRRLEGVDLPAGVRLEFGGKEESSGDANAALFSAMPVGVVLLLIFLLIEFNSFRRLMIVLVTVPLATTGVVPGLLLTNNPFGFTAMLGVFALVGIVVNNAIVLIDLLDANLAAGESLSDAIADAVARRTRPILLTTVTTVAGLAPLTLTKSTLWPPLAWSIISGLLASTLLTLLVVPAMCRLLLRSDFEPASEGNTVARAS